jgi:serpin B
MKKLALVLVLVLSLSISGCAVQTEAKPEASPMAHSTNLMSDIKPRSVSVKPSADAAADFALGLLKTAYDGKNTVVSPVSAYLALSMVSNGASGDTLKEFESVLGAPTGELNDAGKALMDALNRSSDGLTLKTVNGIWYNSARHFKAAPAFLQTNADYFGAAEIAADFSKPETLEEINRFVSDNTNKLIPSILDNLDPDTLMVLVNTLYFKGKWDSMFIPQFTKDADFTTADGKTVQTPTMQQLYDSIRYFDTGEARGIVLPYQDARFAYVAVLPKGSVTDCLSGLTPDSFKSMIASASNKKVQLFIPKYNVSCGLDLNDILQSMGLKKAFDSAQADFSAIGKADNNIYIGKAIQKVVFKLNEEGTEASAATAIMMELGAAPNQQKEPVVFRLDRPFIYALMDMQTYTPLFLGVMDDPTIAE